jgi:Tol biopolymer transport system component
MMGSTRRFVCLLVGGIACGGGGAVEEREPVPYLGLTPPGATVEMFAPGVVSTEGRRELNSVFTPDGREFYFSIADSTGATVMVMRWDGEEWTAPAAAGFTTGYGEVDPFVSPDGNRMFFGSRAPREGTEPEENWQIWVVDRQGDGWGEARPLSDAVNSGTRQIYPAVASDGTLYFQSTREGTLGESDIFVSRLVNGEYTAAENVGMPISSEFAEGDVYIAPDQSYVIFVSSDRPGSHGSGDLYISYRQEDGSWSDAQNLGPTINTDQFDYCPIVSPDGEYFFYSSGGDVYWVSAGFIEELRRNAPGAS